MGLPLVAWRTLLTMTAAVVAATATAPLVAVTRICQRSSDTVELTLGLWPPPGGLYTLDVGMSSSRLLLRQIMELSRRFGRRSTPDPRRTTCRSCKLYSIL